MFGVRFQNIELVKFTMDGFRIDIYEYDIHEELQPISKVRCELFQKDLAYHVSIRCPRNSFTGTFEPAYYSMTDTPRYALTMNDVTIM